MGNDRRNDVIYQMEAWSADRAGFVQRMATMMFGTQYMADHELYLGNGLGVSKNAQKPSPLVDLYGTLSDASRCTLARHLEDSTADMVKMVSDMEATHRAATFLPDTYTEGVHADWWGGLVSTYCGGASG